MKILTKEEVEINLDIILDVINNGTIFIHPTDTIYGIGCNATNKQFVNKIREIKGRVDTPFSIIAPSKKWIRENCIVDEEAEKWLKNLPGAYTLILKTKNNNCIAENVAPGLRTLGVRIPDHWFSTIIQKLGIPIITTSANKVGEEFMTSLEDLNDEIKPKIEFMVYEGEKHGSPSKIVDLTEKKY